MHIKWPHSFYLLYSVFFPPHISLQAHGIGAVYGLHFSPSFHIQMEEVGPKPSTEQEGWFVGLQNLAFVFSTFP